MHSCIRMKLISEAILDFLPGFFAQISHMCAMQAVSQWMNAHTGIINTGSADLDSLIQILLSTGMFVAGFTAFVLDNTISGTDEERGLTGRHAAEAASKICRDTSYDIPFGMSFIKRYSFFVNFDFTNFTSNPKLAEYSSDHI